MDYSELVTVAAILVYGAYEYNRREKVHKAALQSIREGSAPVIPEAKPLALKIWTTGIVAGLLLLSSFAILYARPGVMYGGYVLYILAFMFLAIFVLILMILVRDLKARRGVHLPSQEA